MIALSGLNEEEIQIRVYRATSGEKLYEEMQHLSEELRPTDHTRILRLVGQGGSVASVAEMCSEFQAQFDTAEVEQLKQAMQRSIPEYQPFLNSQQ